MGIRTHSGIRVVRGNRPGTPTVSATAAVPPKFVPAAALKIFTDIDSIKALNYGEALQRQFKGQEWNLQLDAMATPTQKLNLQRMFNHLQKIQHIDIRLGSAMLRQERHFSYYLELMQRNVEAYSNPLQHESLFQLYHSPAHDTKTFLYGGAIIIRPDLIRINSDTSMVDGAFLLGRLSLLLESGVLD